MFFFMISGELEVKGYLRYKTIFCNKVALDIHLLMILLI